MTAANLKGRSRITAYWYDALDRQTDAVELGTNGGTDYTYSASSIPARSATALRTTTNYDTAGRDFEVIDPRGKSARSEYDAMGRVITRIQNYESTATLTNLMRDNSTYTRFQFTHGLLTKQWVDLNGNGSIDISTSTPPDDGTSDQDTTYVYGVLPTDSSGPSAIASNRLLRKVIYPDSTSSTSDVVLYGYNAQGQRIWAKDQAGNIIQHDYDARGRLTQRRATTIATDFDDAVKRIGVSFDDRGLPSAVTQYDNATVGSGNVVDQVLSGYDDWGQLTSLHQDWNSAVSLSTGDHKSYGYAYDTVTTASHRIRALRRTTISLPGQNVTLFYSNTGNSLDAESNRVSQVRLGATPIAVYRYNGEAALVGVELPQPQLLYNRYSPTASAGVLDRVDRFDRVLRDVWSRAIDTNSDSQYDTYRDLYDSSISYDTGSNITGVQDHVFPHWNYHVRHRAYDAETGRWNQRDPMGYVDGANLYEYAASDPVDGIDPEGLMATNGKGGGGCGTQACGGGTTSNPYPSEAFRPDTDDRVSICNSWANRFCASLRGASISLQCAAGCVAAGTNSCTSGESEAEASRIAAAAVVKCHQPSKQAVFHRCVVSCMNDYYGDDAWALCMALSGFDWLIDNVVGLSSIPKDQHELNMPHKKSEKKNALRKKLLDKQRALRNIEDRAEQRTKLQALKRSKLWAKRAGRLGVQTWGKVGMAAACPYVAGTFLSCQYACR